MGTHAHNASCERIVCGYSETHNHTTSCRNTIKIVHRKYQQSLDDIWPITGDNGKTYNSGERWDPSDTSLYNEVLVYIAVMPGDDFTLTKSTSSNTAKTMDYYLQVLPGEEYDIIFDGKNYKLDFTIVAKLGYFLKTEDFFDINGYVQNDSNPSFGSGTTIRNQNEIDLGNYKGYFYQVH